MSTTAKGVTIIAIGGDNKRSAVYGKFAYNLALSLKYHSPNVPIHLIWNKVGIGALSRQQLKAFDYETEIAQEYCFEDGIFTPSKAKMFMYDYLLFDETIYIDADSLLIKPIERLFDKCKKDYYVSLLIDEKTNKPAIAKAQTRGFKYMMWADIETIWNHYDLNGQQMPATNSSWQFIRKSETCEKLYRQIQANYANPILNLQQAWGKGKQPDELYLNIALAQLDMIPYLGEEPVMYANERTIDVVKDYEKHYLLTFFGHRTYTHATVIRQGDQELKRICKGRVDFKLATMMRDKYLDVK